MKKTSLDRRSFLGATAALATTTTVAACGSSTGGAGDDAAANAAVELPNHIPFTGANPDIKSEHELVPDTFFAYPKDPVKVYDSPPGDGSAVQAMVPVNGATPPPMDKNSYWQSLNEAIGVQLEINMTPAADYNQKFAANVAGGNTGDVFMVDGEFAKLPQFLKAECADLTEFLSGNAVERYPFLASIPSACWQECVYNGGIYGLPIVRGITSSSAIYAREDICQERGIDPADIESWDDFMAALQEVNDPNNGSWALAGGILDHIAAALDLPNRWDESDGRFTNVIEADEYKEALQIGADMVEDGLLHPDAFDSTTQDAKDTFKSGAAVFQADSYTSVSGKVLAGKDGTVDGLEVSMIKAPGMNGPARMWQGGLNHAIAAIRQADSDRVEMILSVLDYLGAPVGTQENLQRKYGNEGEHYELDGTDPVLTDKGASEALNGFFPVEYISNTARENYNPGWPDVSEMVSEHMESCVPESKADAAYGLYSATSADTGGRLDTQLDDARTQIMLGRQPVDSWDDTVAKWKSDGGDRMREEFEKAFEESQ